MFVDPLAEKYPGWTPYHYVHNNPVNMIDPTGMEADGWIEWTSEKGDKHLTYDSAVNTKEEAITKGYTNVDSVSQEGTLSHNNENLDLKADGRLVNISGGKFGGDIDDMSFRSSDNVWVSENKGIIDAFGDFLPESLSTTGDLLTYGGTAATLVGGGVVGVPLASLGGVISLVGTGLEIVNDIFEAKPFGYVVEKLITKAVMTIATGKVGKLGKNDSERMVNEATMSILDKTIDDARNNKKGPYKENKKE